MPSDGIVVYYDSSPDLSHIISLFSDFIFATIKQPIVAYPIPHDADVIISETIMVS